MYMKKLRYLQIKAFLYFAILPCMFGCSNDVEDYAANDDDAVQNSGIRSLDEAYQIANNAIGILNNGAVSRSSIRMIDKGSTKVIKNTLTRSTNSDTLLYIINYADGKGFAVVSANKNTEGLLAVTEEGTYDENAESQKENAAFADFMESAKNYASLKPSVDTVRLSGLQQIKYVTDTISKKSVAAKVTQQWGQSDTDIEGKYCPNNTAGCSNIAMAQIMSYFEYPSSIKLTFDNNSGSLSLNWLDIKKHKTSHMYSYCSASSNAHDVIGKLIRQLGEMNNSEYKKDGTYVAINDVKNSFSNLGYSISSIKDYDNEIFYDQLNDNKLIYMQGYRKTDNVTMVGHAWVVDGCYQVKTHSYEYVKDSGSLVWTLLNDCGISTTSYIHINWGWYGSCNGMFSVNVLATNSAVQYDNKYLSNKTARSYTYDMQYVEVTH